MLNIEIPEKFVEKADNLLPKLTNTVDSVNDFINNNAKPTLEDIDEFVKNGLPRSLFTFRGYGGTRPIATNATAEGRAMNRRVIITARPKATYIQRQ